MLNRLIHWSAQHAGLVLLSCLLLAMAGLWSVQHTPLDALPDLSDTQVIVYTEMPGQSPQVVEDQLTFPLASSLLTVPQAKVVRGFSNFGASFIYVIFNDGTDPYWARARVNEALASVGDKLPAGITPTLGPDASGVGWVYQYALQSKTLNLAELRSLQDWQLRYQLAKVPGVAEVASLGGFVQEYQVVIDPLRLRAFGITPETLINALRAKQQDVGGGLLEMSEREIMLRSLGYLRNLDDIRQIELGRRNSNAANAVNSTNAENAANSTPLRIQDVAQVELTSAARRGVGELNGEGEAVSGIVVARHGVHALEVIDGIKARLEEIRHSLPDTVEIVTVYDRSTLIHQVIDGLKHTLLEEMLIVALVCLLFLLHVRSALVAILMLPLGLLIAFIGLRFFGISSNIMSLGGLAIAIGAMVDAAIVMVENAHKHLEHLPAGHSAAERRQAIIRAAQEVGPALFYSLCIITLSFLPVFALEAEEGRLFAPLAWTKTLAMAAAAGLSVTLVPVLMLYFIRGRIRSEAANPVNRLFSRAYRPLLETALRRPWLTLMLAILLLLATLYPARQLGTEFMPELDEGALLFMPTTQPGLTLTQANALLQRQDRIIKSFPEVASVYGKAGRANTATDPAPTEMFETLIQLQPKSAWRAGMTRTKLIAEMDQALQLPGMANAWTQPIKGRIDMLSTGMKTPLGIKITGPDLDGISTLATQLENSLRSVPGTSSVYAERTLGGHYLDITPDRNALARYGISLTRFQDTLASTLGGDQLNTLIDGRARYAVSLRLARELRDSPQQLAEEIKFTSADGQWLPLKALAQLELKTGPASIRSENAQLAAYLYIDSRESDLGSYLQRLQQTVSQQIQLSPGYSLTWSGQIEGMERAAKRMQILIPLTLIAILLLLYLNFGRLSAALTVMLSLPFALIGGVWLLWSLDYNLSVASAVGFIALAGVAAETGVVMLVYLDQALLAARKQQALLPGQALSKSQLDAAIIQGALGRLRPKTMTVCAIIMGLLPIMWSSGSGAEVMRRIAAPMIGGMLSSTLLTLLVIPVIYKLLRQREASSKPTTPQ